MKRHYYEIEETKITKKKGYVEVEDTYTQVYDNLMHLTFKMKSVVEPQLMFYICTISNNSGIFTSNESLYSNFCKESNKNNGGTLTRRTFDTALNALTNSKILIRLSKGQYQLNPLVLWRDSISDRDTHIENIMQIQDKKEKDKYLLL